MHICLECYELFASWVMRTSFVGRLSRPFIYALNPFIYGLCFIRLVYGFGPTLLTVRLVLLFIWF